MEYSQEPQAMPDPSLHKTKAVKMHGSMAVVQTELLVGTSEDGTTGWHHCRVQKKVAEK